MSNSGYTPPSTTRRDDDTYRRSRNYKQSESSYSYTDSDITRTRSPTDRQRTTVLSKKPKPKPRKKPQKKKVPVASIPMDNTTKRMFSATAKTYRTLSSHKQNLVAQCEEVSNENRTLKRQARLQRKELYLYQNTVDGVESILKRHVYEVEHVTGEQKEVKAECIRTEGQVKQREKELEMANTELSRLRLLMDKDGSLPPAEVLQDKLSTVQTSLEEEKQKVLNLTEQLRELETENRKKCGSQRFKSKDTGSQIQDLMTQNRLLKKQIKDKEKEIAAKSMYRRGEGKGTNSSATSARVGSVANGN